MLFVHQVVARPEGHQVGVVGRCRNGDGACAAHVGVTQLVGEDLQLVRWEVVVVPEDVVVWRPAGALQGGTSIKQPSEQQLPWGRGYNLRAGLPGCRRDCTGRSRTLKDEWFWCRLWCRQECCRSCQPAGTHNALEQLFKMSEGSHPSKSSEVHWVVQSSPVTELFHLNKRLILQIQPYCHNKTRFKAPINLDCFLFFFLMLACPHS